MEDFSTKIDQLVRLGLMPVQDLPYLKRALQHIKSDMFLPIRERKVFYRFVENILKITLDSPALLRLIKNKTGALRRTPMGESMDERVVGHIEPKKKEPTFGAGPSKKFRNWLKGDKHTDTTKSSEGDIDRAPPTASEETVNTKKLLEHVRRRGNKFVVTNKSGNKTLGTHSSRSSAVKQLQAIEISKHAHGESVVEEVIVEGLNFRNLPIGTLRAYATVLSRKKKNGGHITTNDKTLASLAKKELLRRKHLGEDMEYTERFNDALKHFNVADVAELDGDTMKEFLAFVDTQNEAVISANSRAHLPASDAIKAQVAADMAKRKAVKDRLMAAAKDEYHASLNSNKKEPSAARKLFAKDLKVKSESVHEEAGAVTATSPNCTYCGGKVRTISGNKKTQGHSGRCENCGKRQ